jgi:small subunit ribosomal protein S9
MTEEPDSTDRPEEESQASAEEQPPAPDEQPTAQEEQPPAPDEQPTAQEEQPPAPDEQPASPEPAPVADEQAPAPVAAQRGDAAPPEPPASTEPASRAARTGEPEEEVIPGAHLEPDLVLEPDPVPSAYAEDADPAFPEDPGSSEGGDAPVAEPVPTRAAIELAKDARYLGTGKRKTAVARVILKPGQGVYTVNGRALEEFFPRPALQTRARQSLDSVGYASRMDVVARLHGGGVSSQAGALRHGVARALVEADPNLRAELKKRGFLTRDAREKERKKAGLKKARKRPQFSKR